MTGSLSGYANAFLNCIKEEYACKNYLLIRNCDNFREKVSNASTMLVSKRERIMPASPEDLFFGKRAILSGSMLAGVLACVLIL